MTKFKNIFLSSVFLVQIGCASLASKEHVLSTDRLPANNPNIVMLLGAERTAENIQSEESVNRLILSLQNNFRYCYEKELNSNPTLNTELFFYFGITKGGLVRHVTNEAIAGSGNTAELSQCISTVISRIRAPSSNQDLVFRARLRFQTGR